MTSKLKCPVCQHKLYQTASEPATYCCLYKDCTSDFKLAGSKELWQALIQAKQDLEIARKALTDIFFICELDASKDANTRVSEIYTIAKKVLEHKV